MATEPMIRAFLLGMADPEVERTIEEGILSGSVPTEDLVVIEEELLDDHAFGRLSPDEEAAFRTSFIINLERRRKVEFGRAMRKYVVKHAPAGRWLSFSIGVIPRFALASSFALFGVVTIAVVWLGMRDLRLGRELAEVTRTSDERQKLLASLMEQERERPAATEHRETAPSPALAQSAPATNPVLPPGIDLRPGVRRGVEAIPSLHLGDGTGSVRITLELAFTPQGGLREELFRAGGERIWIQEISSPGPVVTRGTTTLYLPEQLLPPGDYQIRLKDLASDASDEGDVYAFRVRQP